MTEAHARGTDPATAHEAAEFVSEYLPELEAEVLAVIKTCGANGATIDDLTSKMAIQKVSISPRLRPLANKNLIRESGRRKGLSGRPQIIWVAARRAK